MKEKTYNHIIEHLPQLKVDIERGKVLNKTVQYQRYAMVWLRNRYVYEHQIMAVAMGWDTIGKTVNHKNGDRYDNRPSNLEVLSLKDNIRHAKETGLNGEFIIDDDEKGKIRDEYANGGISQAAIARRYGVTRSYINLIIHQKT